MPFKQNKNEILYNIINAAIAGALVFAGSVVSGEISSKGIAVSVAAAMTVVLIKFQAYWEKEKGKYSSKISKALTFI